MIIDSFEIQIVKYLTDHNKDLYICIMFATVPTCTKTASVCNAQFTEAALSYCFRHFLHISVLKHEQKLCFETVGQKQDGLLNSTNWVQEKSNFSIIAAVSTERLNVN